MFKNLGLTIIFYTAIILAVAGFFLGKRAYQNDAVNGLVGLVDLKDRSCRASASAPGVDCPAGCLPRPVKGPEEMRKGYECRSRLWIRTCASDCETRKRLIRLPSGKFADSGELILQMSSSASSSQGEFGVLGIELENGISGLYRYRATFENQYDSLDKVEELKEKLEDMPQVLTVDYAIK